MERSFIFNTKKKFMHKLAIIGLGIFGLPFFVAAQKNLAPTATAAASTCNTGACATLNNQVINATCTQEMWITTTSPPSTTAHVEWFDFTWTTPQSMGSMTIHHGNTATRFLAGADVYSWNATTSAWVFVFTFSGLPNTVCVNSVKFPVNITSTKIRFTRFQASGSQLSNMNFREIEIWQGSTKPNDVGISALAVPLCAPALLATYTNFGTNTVDSAKINWSVNGTPQTQMRYNTATTIGNSANITLAPTYNFVDGTTYTVKAWTSLPNNKTDSVNTNDTSKITFKYQGPAGTPGVADVIKCGPGRAPLMATPVNQGDSIVWYNAATAGNAIAKGKNTLSPPLVLGVNTFYAQAFKISAPQKLSNGVSGTSYYTASAFSGGMFNVTPKNDVVIDSFTTHLVNFNVGQTFNVYMKTGTYIGFETNATVWTLIANGVAGRVLSVGGKSLAYVKIPETSLTKNVLYAFYVTTTSVMANSNYMTTGTMNISDAEMTVTADKMIYGAAPFSTLGTGYFMGLEVHYRKLSCPSARVACKVTVKPSPNGAAFIKSTPFQTTMPNTIGTKGNPDIVAKDDVLTYEITPPTGYNNVDYGTTWIMSGFAFRTKSGRVLPTSYYSPTSPAPSGGANAKITFTADAAIVDSAITMTISVMDLGPHYCDSTLTRNIFIAPRPVADFKFSAPVCDGDNVIFSNTSKVSSGNILNKWNFGTGNPADTSTDADVLFVFPTSGTYNVTLTNTTVPYGYTNSVTIPVVVTEIPKIGFKVYNACLGDSVSFVNSTTISTGSIVYNWDFGNGTSSKKISPKNKYPVAGGYKVTLTATSNGCSQTLTRSAQQFARPIAKYSVSSVLCDKTDISFTNGSTIAIGNMGYNWSFGDGSVTNFASPIHSYTSPGLKTVKMRVISEFGCADSITKAILLAEAPLANFSTSAVCNLSPSVFTFTGTKPTGFTSNFNWDFAGEGTSFSENPSKLFSNVGKKMVTLTVTSNNGCSDVISKEVNVKLQSKADFNITDVCEDDDAVFTNKSSVTSGNLLFNWKFGDGKSSAAQSPRYLYNIGNVTQTFNVTLVAVVPGGCSDSVNKQITVNAKPNPNFILKTSGRQVNFQAIQPLNTTYKWDFGDGGTALGQTATYNYLNYPSGKYQICLTVYNSAGCFSQSCQQAVITGQIDQLNKLNGVDIYPNPNKGDFTISIENPKSDIAIAVYNILGDVVKEIEANPLQSVYPVELNMANGIYIVKVTNGAMVSTQKITVNK